MKQITTLDEINSIANSNSMIVFYADWCGPCKAYKNTYERFARNHPDVNVLKVNIDESRELTEHYGIRSVPSTAFYANGQPSVKVGMVSYNNLEQIFSKNG